MWAIAAKLSNYFTMILMVLPQVFKALLVAEAMFPGSGRGSEKREYIRMALEAAYAVVADGKIDFVTEVWPWIEKRIADRIKKYNDEGGVPKVEIDPALVIPKSE